jgi:hypothetical protein
MKDGRTRGRSVCGVWIAMENKFCEEFVFSLRRCTKHYSNLKKDDLWASLHRMDREQREIALDCLDSIQKRRPSWTYGNPQGEAELIASQEHREREKEI